MTPMTRALGLYAGAALAVTLAAAWALTLGFHGPGDAGAIWLSAAVAIAVQLVAFVIARSVAPQQLTIGWGAGTLLRFLTVVVYAVVVAKVLGMPLVAALVSLATFLFLTTLVEPVFLRR